ncbi:hypothetical protein BC835DRAFT_1454002 [Cytidiella melzeri]|nr:hypothetical protein BC835DRAFT_1454002 [Cytidiella melzeri]
MCAVAGMHLLGRALASWATFCNCPRRCNSPLYQWSRVYSGPMFSLDLLGQHVVLLNTHEVTGDLSGAYLELRSMRRASHESCSSRAVKKYQPIQAEATHQAVLRMIGHLITGRGMLNGAFLGGLIPVMRYIPAWKIETRGLDMVREDEGFNAGALGVHVRRQTWSLEKACAWLAAGVSVIVGAKTARSQGIEHENSALIPCVDRDDAYRAQAEIDAAVGRERVPTLKDIGDLP